MRWSRTSVATACGGLCLVVAFASFVWCNGPAGPGTRNIERSVFPDATAPLPEPPWIHNPECSSHAFSRAEPFPWERLVDTVRHDPSRAGTRVIAAATASELWRSGHGTAFAIAREPSGWVSLYVFEGYGDRDFFREAMRSVHELYMRPDHPWRLLVRVPTMEDFLAWKAADETGLGYMVEWSFRGAGATIQYLWYRGPLQRADSRDSAVSDVALPREIERRDAHE